MKDEMKLKEEMMLQLEKIQETVNLRTRDIEQRVDEMEEGSTERDDIRRKILLGEMKKVLLKLNDTDKEIVKEFKGEAVDHIRNMTKLSNEIGKVKASLEALPEDSEIGLVKEVDELRKKVLVLENEDEGFVACLKMSIETHENSMKAGIEILADSIVTRQKTDSPEGLERDSTSVQNPTRLCTTGIGRLSQYYSPLDQTDYREYFSPLHGGNKTLED